MEEGTIGGSTLASARFAYLVMRVGAAFAFLYPPISAYFAPDTWIGYIPGFARGYVPDMTLLHVFGAVEILIALWILSGWKIFWPSLIATALLLCIVLTNPQEFPILFRDLSVAALTFSLALMNLPKKV